MARNRAERGSILIFLVASVTLLAGAILGLITVEQGRASRARTEIERSKAFTLAEGGIHQVATLLHANAWPAGTTLDWSSDGVDNDADGLVDEGDESLVATAQLWGSDGVDNDGDGLVDETDEGVARVTSTVGIGISSVTLTGWVEHVESPLPFNVPAVLTALDPNADLTFKGNSFDINGNDTLLGGKKGPAGSPVLGIAINGTLAQVLKQLSKQQLNNVVGLGGLPSVGVWNPPASGWIEDLIQAMAPIAGLTFTNYSPSYKGNLGDWTTGNYLITYSKGNLKMAGGTKGAGVLMVDGDLELSGNFEYVGYVFVTGALRVTGGGNGQILTGATFVGSDVHQTYTGNPTKQALLKGGLHLQYSSDALGRVRTATGGYRIVATTEP